MKSVLIDHLEGKTRIIVTQSYYLLPIVDKVIYLDEGEVKFYGNFVELKQSGIDVTSILEM